MILSTRLPFAVVPLVAFTANRELMGEHAPPRRPSAVARVIAAVIVALIVRLPGDVPTG